MDGSHADGFRPTPWWLLAVGIIVAAQAGLALRVVGGWESLNDDRPVLAGRHPLHLYHGTLGAQTFQQRYATSCFDPNFQAGYPKTPVFDSGCRPAEFLLTVLGTNAPARNYKRGLFLCCLMVPIAFIIAGRGIGLPAGGCCVAGVFGCGVWWSVPVRMIFDAGDLDLLFSGLSAIVFVAWLSRYNWEPGLTSWAVLATASVVGWYSHPVVWIGLAPVLGLYYLAVAPRHGPAWHLGLAGVLGIGIALNMWWLWDWAKFWWLRQPSIDAVAPFPSWDTLHESWASTTFLLGPAPWGWPMVLIGLVGCGWFIRQNGRTAPALILLLSVLAVFVARLGQVWPPMINGGTSRAATMLAALAVLPAAGLWGSWAKRAKIGPLLIGLPIALMASLSIIPSVGSMSVTTCGGNLTPLAIGLSSEQEQIVKALSEQTTAEARILYDDTRVVPDGWNWTALLPQLTGRVYLGGIDPDARFEHAFCELRDDQLNGRPLADYSDSDLSEFCLRYNVGWVVCRAAAAKRWEQYPSASIRERFSDSGELVLFEIHRPRSYILAGTANWEQADRRKVVLTNIVPVHAPHPSGGPVPASVIVLSLHYQDGLRVSPNVATIERDPDPYDPIPMIRIRVPGPMSRLVLSWGE